MSITKLRILLAAPLLACAFFTQAQSSDPVFRAALEAAERGQPVPTQFASHPLASHPLYGWLQYAALRRNIDTLSNMQAQAFLSRYRGQAVAEAFREIWLPALSRRQDWSAFRAAWTPGFDSATLRCAELNARQATGAADMQWMRDAQQMWRTGKPLPGSCDDVFALLSVKNGLPAALRWERIELAAAELQPSVMRTAARGLPTDEAALANDYAAFLEAVHDRALTWPKTPRSRLVASHGLARLAKSLPTAADTQLPKFASALGFSEADRGRVLYQAALQTVASYEPDAARRLNAVPEIAYDERLHEWRAREAMARSDWRAALAAIRKMGARQRSDSRWSYFEARLAEMTGDKAGAQTLYRAAARKPEFHGFLAADRLNQPYALCPLVPNDTAAAKSAIARDPAIVRAMALFKLDRTGWAVREWDEALSRYDDDKRRIAVAVAQDNGWYDRAVFSLAKTPSATVNADELRLYKLRFPLNHDATIRREAAKNNIDPAWVAAEIRAESIFNPRARSSANAMGLMQVLPSTGAATARRIGLPYSGADSLYQPDTNIALGSAYLRQMLDKYSQAHYAIAAYNAGPAPVARWQSQRPGFDPDFWIETMSYKETREYVPRVLAFSVLYDWRLNGDALSVSDRIRGRTSGARKGFVCPLATSPNA